MTFRKATHLPLSSLIALWSVLIFWESSSQSLTSKRSNSTPVFHHTFLLLFLPLVLRWSSNLGSRNFSRTLLSGHCHWYWCDQAQGEPHSQRGGSEAWYPSWRYGAAYKGNISSWLRVLNLSIYISHSVPFQVNNIFTDGEVENVNRKEIVLASNSAFLGELRNYHLQR